MKSIKRAPLLGAIVGVLIIIILSITITNSKQECSKLKECNHSLSHLIDKQGKELIDLNAKKEHLQKNIIQLEAEKSSLNTQVFELTEKNKQLEQKQEELRPEPTTRGHEIENPITTSRSQPIITSTNLGQFKITAYCNCSICCGQWAGGKTASGTIPTAGRTIAVDPSIIPLGSKVIFNGHTYVAEDTGSAIKGNKIDLYFNSHTEALNWGVQYINVAVVQ